MSKIIDYIWYSFGYILSAMLMLWLFIAPVHKPLLFWIISIIMVSATIYTSTFGIIMTHKHN